MVFVYTPCFHNVPHVTAAIILAPPSSKSVRGKPKKKTKKHKIIMIHYYIILCRYVHGTVSRQTRQTSIGLKRNKTASPRHGRYRILNNQRNIIFLCFCFGLLNASFVHHRNVHILCCIVRTTKSPNTLLNSSWN